MMNATAACPPARTFVGLVLLGLVSAPPSPADTPTEKAKPPVLTAAQKARLAERNRLQAEASKFYSADDLPQAQAKVEEMLAIDKEVYGEGHDETIGAMNWLAEIQELREDFGAARKLREQVLAVCSKHYNASDWHCADAGRALGQLDRLEKLDAEKRHQLAQADALLRHMWAGVQAGKYRRAVPLAQEALELRRQVLGERHVLIADALVWLGWAYEHVDDYRQAASVYEIALALRKSLLGEMHPDYATVLGNLASAYQSLGRSADAEPLLRKSLAIDKETLGEQHQHYAAALNNLAFLYQRRQDYRRAEELFRQALAIKKEVYGEKDRNYALALDNLAGLYCHKQDYARAQPLLVRAVEILKAEVGESHPEYARSLYNLASVYHSLREYPTAEPFYRQALETARRTQGEKSRAYVFGLINLADLYRDMGDGDRAEPLYRRALELKKEVWGERHPDYIQSMSDVALFYSSRNDPGRAEELLREAVRLGRTTLGEKHWDYAILLHNLAVARSNQGDLAEAESLHRQSLALRKELFGERDSRYRISLEQLAMVLERRADGDEARGDFAAGRQARQEVLDAWTRLHGPTEGETIYCRLRLVDVGRLERMAPEQRRRLAEAADLIRRVGDLNRQKKQAEAVPLAERALAVRAEILGREHYLTGEAADWLGSLLLDCKEWERSLGPLRQAFAARQHSLGEVHPDTLHTLNRIAFVHSGRREFEASARAYREVLAGRRRTLGDKDALVLTSVNNLAVVLKDLARERLDHEDFEAARRAEEEVLDLWKRFGGPQHWQTRNARLLLDDLEQLQRLPPAQRHQLAEARAWMEQAEKYEKEHRYGDALRVVEEALPVRRQILGEGHYLVSDCLEWLGSLHSKMGQYGRAQEYLRQGLRVREQVYGTRHPEYAVTLDSLAFATDRRGFTTEAESLYRAVVAVQKAVWGEDDSRYGMALNNLAILVGKRGDYAQEEHLLRQALGIQKRARGEYDHDYAWTLSNLAVVYSNRGEYTRAEPLLRQASEVFLRARGEQDPDYAWSLQNFADWYEKRGDNARALELWERVRAIYAKVYGTKHPRYAGCVYDLGLLYKHMGDFAKAGALLAEAAAIYKAALGERHPDYASTLSALGDLSQDTGDYARAETLQRQALAIQKQALGETHADYAATLASLGSLHRAMGNYAAAERALERSLELTERIEGEEHPRTASRLTDLAMLYREIGDAVKAEAFLVQARRIRKRTVGDRHPDYAALLSDLAMLYKDRADYDRALEFNGIALDIIKQALPRTHQRYFNTLENRAVILSAKGDHAAAEPLLGEALELRTNALGERHPSTIRSLHNLAMQYWKAGDVNRAEPLIRKVLALRKAVLGEEHPDYVEELHNLAQILRARKDYAGAEALTRQSLRGIRRYFEQTASVLSERQQLLASDELLGHVAGYLSLVVESDRPADGVYDEVLAWKGVVSAHQRLEHAGGDDRPEVRKLRGELAEATRKLATLARVTPEADLARDQRHDLERLSDEVDRLQQALAEASANFRSQLRQQTTTAADLRRALPADCAFVDLMVYNHHHLPTEHWDPKKADLQLVAFVVRGDLAHVVLLRLGPVQPVVDAMTRWRRTYSRADAAAVRRLLWEPLEPHLKGAGTVLVSPYGALGRFPWAALPGPQPGSYLLEERAVAVVPIPQLLPELLNHNPGTGSAGGLLLVGDVDFDAGPGGADASRERRAAARERSGAPLHWGRLPGTAGEVETIRSCYEACGLKGGVALLSGGQATEEAVRRQAARHRYLHFATHGYFAPAALRSALAEASHAGGVDAGDPFARQDVAGYHPGLLSGLVLAGANRPPDPDRDDGILTALEVAGLGLHGVELVTLSACETGLGQQAGGEGLLGLQRAFQTAGARSVIAGLWQVSDRATEALMGRFYDNLWRKKMSKLEALRQAQLWMLREGRRQPALARGLQLLAGPQDGDEDGRLPPYYWAAFVLSGDWR
jgi:tetratricopeptide (TPR) repeat protein